MPLPNPWILGVLLLCTSIAGTAQQPIDELVHGGFAQAVSVHPRGDGIAYVVERRGTVQVLDHGVRVPTPLIDLSDEVGNWRDFGLLGFALDPAFAANGHFYLAYVVDRHHLLHAGTSTYDPLANEYFAPTIVRVTRYTADPASGGRVALPGSRRVLFGENAASGAPLTYTSHGACALAFGRDGTLLVAIGDGASHVGADVGSAPETWWQQALADGILGPATNVGAFRAQQVDSASGKILRLDPATGDGVPGNPFHDPARPRSIRSRLFALGFRNPCRIAVRPGTGSTDPLLGRPGSIYVGDVGHTAYEELDVVTVPGQNFGWPLFQGLGPDNAFANIALGNQFAPNPLAGGACGMPHFRFQDLLRQATRDHAAAFPNPCNAAVAIAPTTPTFQHTMPVLDWRHGQTLARVPVFFGNDPSYVPIGSTSSGVVGVPFAGNASIAGTWHSGIGLPAHFGSCWFHADFGGNWIRRLQFDADERLLAVHEFATVTAPIWLVEHPTDHSLWYIPYHAQEVRRIRFDLEPPPTAAPLADVRYGASTLEVQLDARASSDPAGQPLRYEWDLGDGRRSTAPQLGHKYTGNGHPTTVPVRLTAIDPTGARHTAELPIALDNTPPQVAITSVPNGGLYSLAAPTALPLVATVHDQEHAPGQLAFAWRTTLLHGNHRHPEPVDPQPTTTTALSPTPRDGEFYAYQIELTVTDQAGLATTATAWLFPDTTGASSSVLLTNPTAGDRLLPGEPLQLGAITTGTVRRVEWYADGRLVATATSPPWTSTWVPDQQGPITLVALAIAEDGTSSGSRGTTFHVDAIRTTRRRLGDSGSDGLQPLGPGSVAALESRTLPLGTDAVPHLAGLRFSGIDVPVAARLRRAVVEFTALADDSGPCTLQVRLENSTAPTPLRAEPDDLGRRTFTAPVTWQPPAWTLAASFADQCTPDLAALLQPLVDSPKWTGTALVALTGTGRRRAWSWDGNAPVAPLLTLEWLPPIPPTSSSPIAAGADDAGEGLASGIATNLAVTLPLGRSSNQAQLAGLRFLLPVPRGSTITSARVQFTAAGTDDGPADLAFSIQAADHALPFVNTRYGLALRPRSGTRVPWTPASWQTGSRGAAQYSPELTSLVQEVVSRPGWLAGNAIALFVQGSGTRSARSFESGGAATLQLAFTPPAK